MVSLPNRNKPGLASQSKPTCDDPLAVEICNVDDLLQGVESSIVKIGCVKDAEDKNVGAVMLCKTVDEATGAETIVPKAYMYDGTLIDNYTGPWEICNDLDALICEPATARGVLTTW